jgi:hypothetical protein
MGLRMASPWKHASGVYYFRQRVPADLIKHVGHPIEKVSLKTKNEREAKSKFLTIAAEHQARWDEMRKGKQSFTHRQCVALSKEIYDDFLTKRKTRRTNQRLHRSANFPRHVRGGTEFSDFQPG